MYFVANQNHESGFGTFYTVPGACDGSKAHRRCGRRVAPLRHLPPTMSVMQSKPMGGLWVPILAAMAVALGGCGSSQTVSTPAGAASTVNQSANAPPVTSARADCTGSQLALSYAGTEGATGHLELTLALRNVSGHACLLRGYPAARLLDRTGRALPLHVSRGHGFFPDTLPAPRTVALGPGTTAHFGISFVTNNEYKGARICRTAATAMSAAPGPGVHWQRVSLRPAPRITPCGDQLVVSPVHA